MEKFLNRKKNNIISAEIGGGCKEINAREPVGEKMNPRNTWFLMCCFDILGMSGFLGYIIGKEYMKERLKPP